MRRGPGDLVKLSLGSVGLGDDEVVSGADHLVDLREHGRHALRCWRRVQEAQLAQLEAL